MSSYTLHGKNITKTYPSKCVLDSVSFEFKTGAFYAILGENGAGKSTLLSILAGENLADSGIIELQQESSEDKVHLNSKDMFNVMGSVRQIPLLAQNFSVRDNILLGKKGIITTKIIDDTLNALLFDWDIKIPLNAILSTLTAAERLYVALLAALYKNPYFLLLDEPFVVLTAKQKKTLLVRLQDYRKKNHAVIIITHNIDDALEYADYIYLLKDTKIQPVIKRGTTDFSKKHIESVLFLKTFIKSHEKHKEFTKKNAFDLQSPCLEVRNLFYKQAGGIGLHNLSFSVYSGAITCIYGKRQSGIEQLAHFIMGNFEKKGVRGEVFFENKKLNLKKYTTRFLRMQGVGLLPFDTASYASNPNILVEDMLSFPALLTKKKEDNFFSFRQNFSNNIIASASVNIFAHEPASNLSGGMRQKLLFVRETLGAKKLLILCEPGGGMDKKAADFFTKKINEYAESGTAILILTSAGSDEPMGEYVLHRANFMYSLQGGCFETIA